MKRRPRKLRNITKPTDGIWHPASRGSERMTGWEKVANPAERAVAVMQVLPGNSMWVHQFKSRWGPEAMWELIFAGILRYQVLLGVAEAVVLAPEFCAPDSPQLRRMGERRQAEGASA